eukprot:jgi/Chrzof1/12358/Cz06g31220.t1
MGKVISALEAEDNALLESPTGTGKTLCLLCATLAWRQAYQARGGDKGSNNAVAGVGRPPPMIIYASRTHSQLAQVIKELRNTSYKVRTSVLGSRQQMCLHPKVSKMTGGAANFACKGLVHHKQCQWHNKQRLDRTVSELNSAEVPADPPDIEDLLKVGRTAGVCPYFLSRDLTPDADLVFMPYNYLLDSQTRRTLGPVRWDNAVVIFDEAHNVQEVCSKASSFDLTAVQRITAIADLTKALEVVQKRRLAGSSFSDMIIPGSGSEAGSYDDLHQRLTLGRSTLQALEDKLSELTLPDQGLVKPGDGLFDLLSSVNITQDTLGIFCEMLRQAAAVLSDEEIEQSRTQGAKNAATGLTALLDCLGIAFESQRPVWESQYGAGPMAYKGYRMFIHKEKMATYSNLVEGPTLSYWCFIPGVAMAQLMTQKADSSTNGSSGGGALSSVRVRSVLLTSGTLAPLDTFAHELQLEFKQRLENPHIVSSGQVWIGVVPTGPSGHTLNSSYSCRDNPKYKDDLGNAIVNFARVVPDGLLVFFPAYAVLTNCIEHWKQPSAAGNAGLTIWERICRLKQPVIEPRESAHFAAAIDDYRKKLDNPEYNGAVMFAVCRGKVSEGLDFSDRAGRGVVLTGIPFAATHDPAVKIQRQVLDDEIKAGAAGITRGKGCSGEQWYLQQATRAVNQAMGRVIRHRYDYGAILLCDERFSSTNNQRQLSRWLRDYLVCHSNFGQAIGSLTKFFKDKVNFKAPEGHLSKATAGSTAATAGRVSAFEVVSRIDGNRPALMRQKGGGGGQLLVPKAIDVSGFASISEPETAGG